MQDPRTRELIGKVLLFGVGPLCIAGSMVFISQSGDIVSTGETIVSYMIFMLALAAIAGGAYLWITARQRMRK